MTPPARCLYETLQIPQTATDSEIKKAYRVAALQNHPDKNPDNPHSEETFKQIQHAYSVLSDPHERAWYDNHREEILHGREPGESAVVTSLDLFTYFSNTVYTGFDGDNGFFTVFGGMFDRLWREEPVTEPSPPFASSTTEWSSVREFYHHWEAFSGARSFAVADKWNLAEAPNREIRRAMEKENKRERAKLKKEFNSTVRELVAFVKKRDPRVMQRRKLEEAQRVREEDLRKEQEAVRRRERAVENERVREEREKALEEDAEGLDEILAGIELDERIERRRRRKADAADGNSDIDRDEDAQNDVDTDDTDDDELFEQLYCAACRKPFRSAAQQADHERSKKHRAAVAKLRKQLLAEEHALGNVSLQTDDTGEPDEIFDAAEEMPLPVPQSRSKKKRKKKGIQVLQTSCELEHDEEDTKSSDGTTADDDEKQDKPLVGGSDGAQEGEREVPKEEPEKLSKREKRKLREARRKANGDVIKDAHRCNTCGNPFPSRNKLMRHVETTGHALAR